MRNRTASLAICLIAAACSVENSDLAAEAPARLMGLSELELESCIGVPDHKDEFGATKILTYASTTGAGSGVNLSLPVVGGLSLSGSGGDCRMTVRLDQGRVRAVRYSGNSGTFYAPDSYCAPLVRSCVHELRPPSEKQAAGQ